jgi:hypothetical protein
MATEENQQTDGSFGPSRSANLAITSLTLLAFMANGNTETRGRYSEQVRKGVKLLLRRTTMPSTATDALPLGFIHVPRDEHSRMHAHGYATLVLAHAYGMGDMRHRDEIRTRLTYAIRLIERCQDDSGGWYYDPKKQGHEGSVTVCMVQALRTARDAGVKVDAAVIRQAIRYLEKSQHPTGGFVYSLSHPDRHSYALTAAALSTLFGLGEYNRRPMIENGLRYMDKHFESSIGGRDRWFFYGNFYAAQAMYQAAGTTWGEPYWRRWWPAMRNHLVKQQDPEGYWEHPAGNLFGPAYATAFATLILSVPLEVLPLYQR